MSKIVAMISEDDSLKELCGRIRQRGQFSEKKRKNLQKQMEAELKSLQEENKADWELLRLWLEKKGRLPKGFNKDLDTIGFNINENGIHISKHESDFEHIGSPSMDALKNAFMEFIKMNKLPPFN